MTDEEIRENLMLEYLPTDEGFDVCAVETYAHFLALTRSEQRLYMQTLNDIEHELFVELVTSRAFNKDPVDRNPDQSTRQRSMPTPSAIDGGSTSDRRDPHRMKAPQVLSEHEAAQ